MSEFVYPNNSDHVNPNLNPTQESFWAHGNMSLSPVELSYLERVKESFLKIAFDMRDADNSREEGFIQSFVNNFEQRDIDDWDNSVDGLVALANANLHFARFIAEKVPSARLGVYMPDYVTPSITQMRLEADGPLIDVWSVAPAIGLNTYVINQTYLIDISTLMARYGREYCDFFPTQANRELQRRSAQLNSL